MASIKIILKSYLQLSCEILLHCLVKFLENAEQSYSYI
jgi:hypothetical protein